MSPLACLLASAMVFNRDRAPDSGFSAVVCASLAVVLALVFYYQAFALFADRTGILSADRRNAFSILDEPSIMSVVIAIVYVAMIIYYGREKVSRDILGKFDLLAPRKKHLVKICSAVFYFGSVGWFVFELMMS